MASKDKDLHAQEIEKILEIINLLKKYRIKELRTICKVLDLKYRIVNYWQNGNRTRGLRDDDLYKRVVDNLLDYYDSRGCLNEAETEFLESLNRIS